MCGIVGVHGSPHPVEQVLGALARLEYRGYDSAGLAVVTPTGLTRVRSVGRVMTLVERAQAIGIEAADGAAIGHTRWATHGLVEERNAHPHLDCSGRLAIAHNGIIENADSIRANLVRAGHRLVSDGDSEVLAHLIEDALETGSIDLVDAVGQVLGELVGSWAIVVLDSATGRLVATCRRSPLVVARQGDASLVASDISAILPWASEFRVLDDDVVVDLADHGSVLRRSTPGVPVVLGSPDRVILGDHMAVEIEEQPEIAASILDAFAPDVADGALWGAIGAPTFARIDVIGCGTSVHAGRVLADLIAEVSDLPVRIRIASECNGRAPERGTLVVGISQSGETADVIRAVDDLPASVPVLVLTNQLHSTLARRADWAVPLGAGTEIGVAATKTFTAEVVCGALHLLSGLVAAGRAEQSEVRRMVDELRRTPDLLAQALAVSKQRIPELIPGLRNEPGFLFLGRGGGLPFASEGALKLKELTYRFAEDHAAGELKHGPLALVDATTPVIVIDNGDPRLPGNIAEVRARGGNVIDIGGVSSRIPALGLSVAPPSTRPPCGRSPIESVVPLQVLARLLALQLGRDVDKPRNLAKSVTVE